MARRQRTPGWFNRPQQGESAFGANVMDPGSNIESEEKIVKSADGTVTKTTVSNKQNTPSFQGMQTEQTQGGVEKETQQSYSPEQISSFDQSNMGAGDFGTSYSGGPTQADYLPPNEQGTLIERIAANNANQPGDVYDGPMTDPWAQPEPTAPLVPTDRRAMAAQERALSTEGGNTDISGFGRTPINDVWADTMVRNDIIETAEDTVNIDDFETGRKGAAEFRDAKEKAGQDAISEFDAEQSATDEAFAAIDAENAANNIYEGDAILEDTAAKHLESIEQDFDAVEPGEPGTEDDGGDGTLIKHPDDTSNIQKKLEGGDDPKGIMADISKWYGDNPILARALMGAVVSYVKTGNIYSALGAGVEGGVGALDSIAAGKAEAAKEQRAEAKWNRQEDAKQKDRLELAGYKASIKTGKVPTARETSSANRAYAKSVSDEFSAMVPGEQKNLYRTAFNSGNVAKAMSQIKARYGIDMLEATPEQDAAFKQAATDLLEANARTVARGRKNPKLDTNLFKYMENNIIRSTALDGGVPVGSFDTIDTGDINNEQMKKAFKKVQQARSLKDQSDTELWNIAYSNYNALPDSDKSDLAKAGAKNNMSAFLYFVNVEATFVAK